MTVFKECMVSPSQTRRWWQNTFISKKKPRSVIIELLVCNRTFTTSMNFLQVAHSSIQEVPSFTIIWWIWLEMNIECEDSQRSSLQTFSILISGKLQVIMPTIRITFSWYKLKNMVMVSSQWTVLHIAWCLLQNWEPIESCQLDTVTLVFYTEMKFQELCQDWLG